MSTDMRNQITQRIAFEIAASKTPNLGYFPKIFGDLRTVVRRAGPSPTAPPMVRRTFLVAGLAAAAVGLSGTAAWASINPGTRPANGDRLDGLRPGTIDGAPCRLDMISAKSGECMALADVSGAMTDSDRSLVRRFFRDHDDQGTDHAIADRLIRSLADLQQRAGGRRLILNSGFRTPKTNAAKDGAHNSRHLIGEAADVHIEGLGETALFRLASMTANADRLGFGRYHEGFVHLDVGPERRWVV